MNTDNVFGGSCLSNLITQYLPSKIFGDLLNQQHIGEPHEGMKSMVTNTAQCDFCWSDGVIEKRHILGCKALKQKKLRPNPIIQEIYDSLTYSKPMLCQGWEVFFYTNFPQFNFVFNSSSS